MAISRPTALHRLSRYAVLIAICGGCRSRPSNEPQANPDVAAARARVVCISEICADFQLSPISDSLCRDLPRYCAEDASREETDGRYWDVTNCGEDYVVYCESSDTGRDCAIVGMDVPPCADASPRAVTASAARRGK